MRGVSWEGGEPASACSHLAHSLLTPRGSRDPGILWEQAGSKGSKLQLPEAPGRFQGPSITFGSLQLAPSLLQGLQGPRDALGARGASWEPAGSKGSQLGAS